MTAITRYSISVVAVFLVMMSNSTHTMQLPTAIAEIDDPDAYAVYASIFPITFSSGDRDQTRAAIRQVTHARMDCLPEIGQHLGTEWVPVLESYKQENATARRLRPGINLGVTYTLISQAAMSEVIAKEREEFLTVNQMGQFDTQRAYRTFPNGKLYSLSAVGFNEDKTRALVAIQHSCGFDCAGGGLVLRDRTTSSELRFSNSS